jgi:hypothetical protein
MPSNRWAGQCRCWSIWVATRIGGDLERSHCGHRPGPVSFRVRDSAHGNRRRMLRLPAEIFIDRFLLHVLPGVSPHPPLRPAGTAAKA